MGKSPFYLNDCNLALVATGEVAESLIEMRDRLYQVSTGSLYYHFWGSRLRLSFVHPEFHNDFAKWANLGLRDDILTERLSIIDPTEYPDLEALRRKVIDVIEERIDESEYFFWSRKEEKFHFIRSVTIVYDTGRTALVPSDLKGIVPILTLTSIFYHFIDARRRTPDKTDDFSAWLSSFGDQFGPLIDKIKQIDPYFLSLSEIRQDLVNLFNEFL